MKEDRTTIVTNVDVDVLAKSPLVRAFMVRTLEHCRDRLTGHIFRSIVAARAAEAFDLYYDDGPGFARTLLDVAASVIDHDRATRRADKSTASEQPRCCPQRTARR